MNEGQDNAVAPEVVMPAIYGFKFTCASSISHKWGWHRARELVEAVRNILICNEHAPMTNAELCRAFPEVNLLNNHLDHEGSSRSPKWCAEVNQAGELSRMSDHCVHNPGKDWLTSLVEHDHYIPAGIGMELIQAVKSSAETAQILRAEPTRHI